MQGINKSLVLLGRRPLVAWSLTTFQEHPLITEIILVAPTHDRVAHEWIAANSGFSKLTKIVDGGAERQHSVHNGLRAIAHADIVVIHNAANPFVASYEISTVIVGAADIGAAAVGTPSPYTLRRVRNDAIASGTIPRHDVWCMQTPQALRWRLAVDAFDRAARDGFVGTDDLELVERMGCPAQILPASPHNRKITTREDLELAEALAELRSARAAEGR